MSATIAPPAGEALDPRRDRRRVVSITLVIAIAAIAAFTRTSFSPLQEAIRHSLGLDDTDMALLQGPATGLPVLVSAIPIGALIDRTSRVRLLMALTLLALIAGIVTSLAASVTGLAVGRVLIGLATPAIALTTISLLADLSAITVRGRVLMTLGIAQVLGMAAAFALGGWLLAHTSGAAQPWRQVMVELTVGTGLASVLVLLLREPRRYGGPVPERGACIPVSALWRARQLILPLILASMLVGMADVAALIWGAPMLARDFGVSAATVGIDMAFVLAASGVAGPLLAGPLADVAQRRAGPGGTAAAIATLAMIGVPAGCFSLMGSAIAACGVLALFLTLGTAIGAMVATLTTIIIPAELRGLCLSISGALGVAAGLGVSPVIVSLLAARLGGVDPLSLALSLVSAGGSLACAIAMFCARPAMARILFVHGVSSDV